MSVLSDTEIKVVELLCTKSNEDVSQHLRCNFMSCKSVVKFQSSVEVANWVRFHFSNLQVRLDVFLKYVQVDQCSVYRIAVVM